MAAGFRPRARAGIMGDAEAARDVGFVVYWLVKRLWVRRQTFPRPGCSAAPPSGLRGILKRPFVTRQMRWLRSPRVAASPVFTKPTSFPLEKNETNGEGQTLCVFRNAKSSNTAPGPHGTSRWATPPCSRKLFRVKPRQRAEANLLPRSGGNYFACLRPGEF